MITPNTYSALTLLNILSQERLRLKQNTVEERPVQNAVPLHSRSSQHDIGSVNLSAIHNEMRQVSRTEVQNNADRTGTNKVAPHVLQEVPFNIAGSTYDTIPTEVMKSQDEEHLSLLEKAMRSAPKGGRNEIKPSGEAKPTTLILKPTAKAVAGANGVSIAAPLSRAVLRGDQELNIHFEPDAVAVVGPGGFADAHSDLLISYYKDLPSQVS